MMFLIIKIVSCYEMIKCNLKQFSLIFTMYIYVTLWPKKSNLWNFRKLKKAIPCYFATKEISATEKASKVANAHFVQESTVSSSATFFSENKRGVEKLKININLSVTC